MWLDCLLALWGSVGVLATNSVPPNFAVASVKPHHFYQVPGDKERQEKLLDFVGMHDGGTRVIMNAVSLRYAAAVAYDLHIGDPMPVVSAAWMENEKWDIYAKTTGPCLATAQRRMLQNLLTDRFGLQVAWDSRHRLHLLAAHRATIRY